MPAPGVHAHAAALMRSLLFVPADGGRKLDKAMASGADAVIVDLEDSIVPERKSDARRSAADFLRDAMQEHRRPRLIARVNGLATGLIDADLGAQASHDADGRLLDVYRLARAVCLAGAAAAQVQAIDTVAVDFRDLAALRRVTDEARRDGFTGKMAIHPAQVAVINEVFTPSAEAIAKAQAIVDAFAAAPNAGVVGIGGVMYDRPHLSRADRLLARARPGPGAT